MTQLEVVSRRPPGTAKGSLLFVHGAWHGAWSWDLGFLDAMVEHGYHATAMSLRNHGQSDPSGSLRWMRYSAFVHDIRTVARSIGPVVLIGHSMGGYLIQKILESESARGAVLIAPVPVSGTLKATVRFARRHPWQYAKVLAQARLWPVVSSPELAGDVLLSDAEHPMALELSDQLQDESFRTYLDMMLFALPRPERARTATPMLVVGGTEDRLFSVAEFRRTAEAWGAELRIIEGAPHDLMLAPGWRRVADSVAAWVGGLPDADR